MQWKEGDQVVLKSGGPTMTVRWVDDTGVYCEWFDNKDVKGALFAPGQLRQA